MHINTLVSAQREREREGGSETREAGSERVRERERDNSVAKTRAAIMKTCKRGINTKKKKDRKKVNGDGNRQKLFISLLFYVFLVLC